MKKSLIFLIAGSFILATALHAADFQEHLNQFNKAVAAKDLASAGKYADDAIKQLGTIPQMHLVPHRCNDFLRPYLNAKDFKTVDKLYRSMIANLTGVNKAILLDNYAKFLAKEKLAKPEEIQKIKAERYSVKELTPELKLQFLLDDNRLPEADKLAQTMKMDGNALNRLTDAFRKKGVYGSRYAQKYGQKRIDLSANDDEKVARTLEYLDYCVEYALISEEDAFAQKAKCKTLPGLTDNGRWTIKLHDYKMAEDVEERCKIMQDLIGQINNDSRRMQTVYDLLSRLPATPQVIELYEKQMFPTENDHSRFERWIPVYVNKSKELGRYKETVKYLTDFAVAKKEPAYYRAVAVCYVSFGGRYYATPDPEMLKRAMNAYQIAYELLPVGDCYARISILMQQMNLALQCNDRAMVETYAAMIKNMVIPDNYRQKTACENAKAFLTAVPCAKAAYKEDDYETVVDILKPVLGKRQHFPGATSPDCGDAYEMFVRSLVALGKYEEALKYTDDMIRTAPNYMRKRLEHQVNELRARAAEEKK